MSHTRSCLAKWYPELTGEAVMEACPICRGICNCRKCLRTSRFVPPAYLPQQRAAQAQLVIHHVRPHVRKLLEDQQAWGCGGLGGWGGGPWVGMMQPATACCYYHAGWLHWVWSVWCDCWGMAHAYQHVPDRQQPSTPTVCCSTTSVSCMA
jgi:hypothetical protein